MKALVLLIILSAPVRAQNDCERTVDSLRKELAIAQSEARRADAQSNSFAYLASLPHYDVQVKRKDDSPTLSPFIAGGFEGRAHIDAGLFGGFGIEYKNGGFGLEAGARYEYSSPQPIRDSVVAPKWHPAFEGALKIFLF